MDLSLGKLIAGGARQLRAQLIHLLCRSPRCCLEFRTLGFICFLP